MSQPRTSTPARTFGPIRPPGTSTRGIVACDELSESYDDEQDHTRCVDCRGSGWYVGFTERRYCPTCEGSGFV